MKSIIKINKYKIIKLTCSYLTELLSFIILNK